MSVGFNDAHGSAQKTGLDYIKLIEGENRFRLVGDLRPRYCYWKELRTNSIPVECLSFDPTIEKFTNKDMDWFKHYFSDAKCVWSYVIQAIDEKDNKLSLRALVKYLDNISDEDIPGLNIPTGIPLVYELDAGLKPLRHYYLGDADGVRKAIDRVAKQGKAAP